MNAMGLEVEQSMLTSASGRGSVVQTSLSAAVKEDRLRPESPPGGFSTFRCHAGDLGSIPRQREYFFGKISFKFDFLKKETH